MKPQKYVVFSGKKANKINKIISTKTGWKHVRMFSHQWKSITRFRELYWQKKLNLGGIQQGYIYISQPPLQAFSQAPFQTTHDPHEKPTPKQKPCLLLRTLELQKRHKVGRQFQVGSGSIHNVSPA